MKPQESNLDRPRSGRPPNVTPRELADRARRVRSQLLLGKGPKEIQFEENLTVREYQTAVKWIARRWDSNAQAYAEYLAATQAQLEALQMRLNAVLGDPTVFEPQKALIAVKIHDLIGRLHFNVREMGLRLGVLEREELKVNFRREFVVSFGDENETPWYSKKSKREPSAAVIDVVPPELPQTAI